MYFRDSFTVNWSDPVNVHPVLPSTLSFLVPCIDWEDGSGTPSQSPRGSSFSVPGVVFPSLVSTRGIRRPKRHEVTGRVRTVCHLRVMYKQHTYNLFVDRPLPREPIEYNLFRFPTGSRT